MIDRRAAAFLQEMGITPLWTPRDAQAEAPLEMEAEAPVQAVEEPAPAEPTPAELRAARLNTPPVSAHFPRPVESAWGDEPDVPMTDEEIARLDWAGLRTAIASCTRCSHCKPPRKPVYGAGDQKAVWLVAAGAASAVDEQAKSPVAGDAGKLLDNMLAAVDLSRESGAYVTNLIKCRPVSPNGGDRAPTADEATACRPYLERELALTGAKMVLTLGQIAANALQDKPLQEPLAGSRGEVRVFKDAQLVATLHPGELLRRGADKALAWADLCLARTHDGRTG